MSAGEDFTEAPVVARRPAPRLWATPAIIAVTVLAWLIGLIPGTDLASRFGFAPVYSYYEPWRALTVALVHDSPAPMHLAFNMIGVFFFGGFLERALGPAKMLTAYVLSALGGSVAVLCFAVAGLAPVYALHIGASGAVFGLLGVVLTPTRRLDRNWSGALVFLALNLGYGLLIGGVSWESHLGGLVVGFFLGCAGLMPRSSRARSIGFWTAALVLAGALAAVYRVLV